MEEETGEPAETEGEEIEEAPPKKGKGKLVVIVAIVVVALLAIMAVFVLFLQNTPPTVSFVASSVDTHVSVNAENTTDPDGDTIASYTWNWGDGSTPSAGGLITTTHDYAQAGTYTITLSVADSRGAAASGSQSITLVILPTPYFLARQQGMSTSFDASGSTASPGGTITAYQWNYGDGTNDTGPVHVHSYATPGRYTVTLTVTQTGGVQNSVSRYVSANTTTVDILANQFFVSGCPYQNYWTLRYRTYGDVIQLNQVPCTDYYPWILYKNFPSTNPSWLYSLYRLDAQVTNNLGYSVNDPVMLPVFNPAEPPAANSFIYENLTFDYLNSADITFWNNYPTSDNPTWPVNTKYGDGFGYLVRGNITMDLQESKRIFGVVASTAAEAQSWWYANTKFGGQNFGPVETKTAIWLDQEGNGKYDIWNGFQWYYEADITDLNATVAPDGTTTIRVFWDGWGYDTLMARWFYWGSQNYSKAVNAPYGQYAPLGWMPFETCWCENATINAKITRGLDLNFGATSEYWWGAVGNPGPDGILNTTDDLAGWSFAPSLMDYVPRAGSGLIGASAYPNSELRWYEPYTSFVSSPGSYAYGQRFEYMVVPNRWNMSLGNTLTLVLPRWKVPFADPVRSYWDSVRNIGNYTYFYSTLTLRSVTPGTGYWLWDPRGKVLSVAAPAGFSWGPNTLPLSSSPTIEFGPESTGG